MARYAGSQGKGPKKSKRDKLKASVHIERVGSDKDSTRTRIHRINDGDPNVYGETERKRRYSKKAANPNLVRPETKGRTRSRRANTAKTRKQYPSK